MSDTTVSDLFQDQDLFQAFEDSDSDDDATYRPPQLPSSPCSSSDDEERRLLQTRTSNEPTVTSNEPTGTSNESSVESSVLVTLPENASRKKNVRKQVRNVKLWKVNVLKEKHQAGQEYTNHKGKPAKSIKNFKDCLNACRFKCSQKVTESERCQIFTGFYKLSHNEKHIFLLNTTERTATCRPNKAIENSHKQYSYKYFFQVHNDKIQVCKQFFLGTLSISQKPIYNAHNNKDSGVNIPKPDNRGKSSSRRLKISAKNVVINHINLFPKVESHYCRSNTKRQYLEASLTLQKMYNMYCEYCSSLQEPIVPVKYSMYRYIFNTQFNLSFHIRKTDRCDLCEEFSNSKELGMTEILTQKYNIHVCEKNSMRKVRKKDKNEADIPVLCFDLQNVICLPRADISSFFYKRKLTMYNLTAHLSTSKTVYCAVWTECMSGRGGNEIASAFKKILEKVVEEHEIKKLITWSDSCVPQNRNSFISVAVLSFLQENPQMESIQMKYSVPGHSCIQEVDNIHSQIEKAMKHCEIFSPIGVIRLLKSINPKRPFRVLQMFQNDFKDFGAIAKTLNFSEVPFLSVCSLRFTQNTNQFAFLTSFSHTLFRLVNLRAKDRPKRTVSAPSQSNIDLNVKTYKNPAVISKEKVNDIMSLLKFMPLQDQEYYKALLKK